jgi:hypothetical protein
MIGLAAAKTIHKYWECVPRTTCRAEQRQRNAADVIISHHYTRKTSPKRERDRTSSSDSLLARKNKEKSTYFCRYSCLWCGNDKRAPRGGGERVGWNHKPARNKHTHKYMMIIIVYAAVLWELWRHCLKFTDGRKIHSESLARSIKIEISATRSNAADVDENRRGEKVHYSFRRYSRGSASQWLALKLRLQHWGWFECWLKEQTTKWYEKSEESALQETRC